MIGLVIEEITEEEETVSSENYDGSTAKYSVSPPQESSGSSKSQAGINIEAPSTNAECVQALKDDPEAMRFVCLHERIFEICFAFAWIRYYRSGQLRNWLLHMDIMMSSHITFCASLVNSFEILENMQT